MTSAQLKDLKGKAVGEFSFADDVFGIEPNTHVLHAALHRQLTNARSGTASAKTRAEVRGGGRKPWKQKGTGRARAGSTRSPLWAGGGVIFGPKPRDYSQSLPKKVRQLALRSALAARRDQFVVVKNFDGLFKNAPVEGHSGTGTVEQPKTKQFVSVLKDLGLAEKKVLLLLDCGVPGAEQIERAARNLCQVTVVHASNLNVKALMECEAVLSSERTVELINNRFKAAQASVQAATPKKVAAKEEAAAKSESAQKKSSAKAPAKAAAPKAKADQSSKTSSKKSDK
jgi:large subunit ribosomal protein L4